MKLVVINSKNMSLFFQVEPQDSLELKKMIVDDDFEEIVKFSDTVRSELKGLNEKREMVNVLVKQFIEKVDLFNMKHNPGYDPKKIEPKV